MTPRQQRFVEEYCLDLNATQAAIRAGYSAKTAGSQGERLLKNAEIQTAIAAFTTKRSLRTEITADRVLLELARLAFSDPRKLFHPNGDLKKIHELDDATAAAVASMDFDDEGNVTKIRLWDKKGSNELIGRHLDLFNTINLKGKLETSPQVNVGALTDDQLRAIQAALAPALAGGSEPRPASP